MTNGSSGVNSADILRSLLDVWKFIEDAKETGKVDQEKLSKAEESFKTAHKELKDSQDASIALEDSKQRCLGGVPYW